MNEAGPYGSSIVFKITREPENDEDSLNDPGISNHVPMMRRRDSSLRIARK